MIQTLQVKSTERTELIDITSRIQEAVRKTGTKDGICFVFVPHTTAGVTINENADPAVVEDIRAQMERMVPLQERYRHLEGNSPAHVKATLTGFSQTVFVQDGKLLLGTWQGIFFCEYDGPRARKVHVKLVGTGG